MSQFDDQLPEDLRDIAARLSAARVTPTPLELDELRRRVHGRAARAPRQRGLAGALRVKAVAGLLTVGLMLTAGVGVGLASGVTGGSITTSYNESASNCQYHKPWSKSYSEWPVKNNSKIVLYVNLVWNGTTLTGSISYNGTGGFSYQFAGSSLHTVTGGSASFTAPTGTPSLTVKAGGITYTFPIVY